MNSKIKKIFVTTLTILLYLFIFWASMGKNKVDEEDNPIGPVKQNEKYKWITVTVSVKSNHNQKVIQSARVELSSRDYGFELIGITNSSGSVFFDLTGKGAPFAIKKTEKVIFDVRAGTTGFYTSSWTAVTATYDNPSPSTTIYLSPN